MAVDATASAIEALSSRFTAMETVVATLSNTVTGVASNVAVLTAGASEVLTVQDLLDVDRWERLAGRSTMDVRGSYREFFDILLSDDRPVHVREEAGHHLDTLAQAHAHLLHLRAEGLLPTSPASNVHTQFLRKLVKGALDRLMPARQTSLDAAAAKSGARPDVYARYLQQSKLPEVYQKMSEAKKDAKDEGKKRKFPPYAAAYVPHTSPRSRAGFAQQGFHSAPAPFYPVAQGKKGGKGFFRQAGGKGYKS